MKRPNRSRRATRSCETGSAEDGSRTSSAPSVRPLSTSGSTSVDVAFAAARRDDGAPGLARATCGRALGGHVRADAAAPVLGVGDDLEVTADGPQHRARFATDERDGLLGHRAERRCVEVVARDHLLAGGHEDAQLLDALGGGELIGGWWRRAWSPWRAPSAGSPRRSCEVRR